MSSKASNRDQIKVGFAERVITPALGGKMAGFGIRKGLSRGVHDDLHVRCMVIEGPQTCVAVVGASLIRLTQDVIDEVRKEVARRTDLPAANIMMAATHTHSGPEPNDEYNAMLKERCIECLVDAWGRRQAARLGVGAGHAEDVGRNRRRLDYGGLPVDPEVGVIKVQDTAGNIKGVLFNYACHPTTMGPDNFQITEDWPYYAIGAIKAEVGGDAVVMFLNGAEGDINPGYSAGLSAIAANIPIRTWEFAEKMGARMGQAVLEALGRIGTKSAIPIGSVSKRVDLPLRKAFPMTLAEAKARHDSASEALDRLRQEPPASQAVMDRAKVDECFARIVAEQAMEFYSKGLGPSVPVELQSIRLDDAALTTFPGEVFVEIQLQVKRRSPFGKTLVIGLANAGQTGGYMPTEEAFAEGDYEVYCTKYSDQAAGVLVEATLEQLAQLA